jgi:hypothetical protein
MSSDTGILREQQSWLRKVALILLAPFAFVIAALVVLPILAGVCLFAGSASWISEQRLRFRMYRCGRYLSFRQAHRRIEAQRGTLIIESWTPGWGVARAWWTPDDVRASLTVGPPTDEERHNAINAIKKSRCLEWDKRCWENYTSPEVGTAFLVRAWSGKSAERRMKKSFPSMSVVDTWTAMVNSWKVQDDLGEGTAS